MTVTVAASPIPILQYFNNAGAFNAGGSILTQVSGINAPTYQDSAGASPLPNPIPLNSRGEVSNASGATCQLFLPINTVYVFTIYDAAGNQIGQANYVNSIQLSTIDWTGIKYDQSAAELAAGVTPTNLYQYYGYVGRYGAVGGGVTDDSAAFANAALVSGTYPMKIPYITGGYLVNTPFALPANGQMQGIGYPLIFTTVAGNHILSAITNGGEFVLSGILFAGTSSSTTPNFGIGGYAPNTTGLVTFAHVTNIRILDCECTAFRNTIAVNGCTQIWVQRNRCTHFYSTGIQMSASGRFSVDFNDVNTCDQAGGVVAYGVQFSGDIEDGFNGQENSISFNRIYGIKSWYGIESHDVDGVRIIGNDIRDVRGGINVGHLVNTNVCSNVIIASNYIEQTSTDTWGGTGAEIAGIEVSGFDATHRVLGVTITGNMIRNFFNVTGMVGAGFGAGCIAVVHCDDVNVTGNVIIGGGTATIAQSTGVLVEGTVNRLTINGNSVQGGSYVRGAIRFEGATCDIVTIAGNSGVQTTTANNHILINDSTITNYGLGVNPSNSNAPYLESGSTITTAIRADSAGSGTTATAVSNGSTIPTARSGVRCTVAGASTGNILAPGVLPNQQATVFNESGANSITMAASGTSNVADGVSCVIAALTQKTFAWDTTTALWYHS